MSAYIVSSTKGLEWLLDSSLNANVGLSCLLEAASYSHYAPDLFHSKMLTRHPIVCFKKIKLNTVNHTAVILKALDSLAAEELAHDGVACHAGISCRGMRSGLQLYFN